MKVLVVPTWYPNGADKLMGIYHKEFTSALNKFGIDADMIFIDRQRISNPSKYLFSRKKVIIEESNYKVYIRKMLNLRPLNYKLYMKVYVHKFEQAFKEYMKEFGKPDIIHAMVSVPAGYAACKVGIKYGVPVITTEHGSVQESLYRDEPDIEYSKFVRENSKMTAVSKFMCDIVKKYGGEATVIPNQVDVELFKNDLKRKIDKEFRIVSVCALRKGKCLDDVFKAISILKDKIDIHYDVIGDGYFEDFYKKSAEDLNVSDRVNFLGRKSKAEVAKLLETEHALVIASDYETFAIPGIEALASGMPVITTDCHGPVEYVDSKCGKIAKVNDPKDLAKAIEYVYKNYDKYDKKYLESIAQKYSEEEVVKIALNEYKSLINSKDDAK